MIDDDKLIELIDDDIAALDFMDMAMSRESYDVCLCTLKMIKQYIKALPAVEAEPIEVRAAYEQKAYNKGYADGIADSVKHGRWIVDQKYGNDVMSGGRMVLCSVCGKGTLDGKHNYCPNCGARMDLIGEDKSHPFAESVMMGMDEVAE